MSKKLRIAVDFDGTLCTYAFPKIGEQTPHHSNLMDILINLRNDGHKLKPLIGVTKKALNLMP